MHQTDWANNLEHHLKLNDDWVLDHLSSSSHSPLGDSETHGPRTSDTRDPSPGGFSSCYCYDGPSHNISARNHAEKVSHTSKSKCENQLAADDFEALFETSK